MHRLLRTVTRRSLGERAPADGIVSLGDLAIERDQDSSLADISAAAPKQ